MLRLGGVTITDSPVGTVAHSDGDVVLHALIDALLGALALGDIGELFPPTDAQWKDADSTLLLAHCLAFIQRHCPAVTVGNVDVTIHLERPKLRDWKPVIRQQVAHLLGISPEQVAIKAKTAEGLGPVGLGQAVACDCAVLLTGESRWA